MLLDLEAKHKLLRLCSAHWKADTFIGQILKNLDLPTKSSKSSNSLDVEGSQREESLPPARVRNLAPMHVAKHTLELSPGPKSPSVSCAQKRTKDGSSLSTQKTTGTKVPSTDGECPIQ